jgi:hypothetical protein
MAQQTGTFFDDLSEAITDVRKHYFSFNFLIFPFYLEKFFE